MDGREPDGTRPETRSRRNTTSPGYSEAKETVVDASTCRMERRARGDRERVREPRGVTTPLQDMNVFVGAV